MKLRKTVKKNLKRKYRAKLKQRMVSQIPRMMIQWLILKRLSKLLKPTRRTNFSAQLRNLRLQRVTLKTKHKMSRLSMKRKKTRLKT